MPSKSRYNSKFEGDSSMAAATLIAANGVPGVQSGSSAPIPENPRKKATGRPKAKDRYTGT